VSYERTATQTVQVIESLASRVYLDRAACTATKVYAPGLLVKLLYWLAFQAPFPYERNEYALAAAERRRKLAGLLTQHWYGQDLVAPLLEISCRDDGCILVSQLIEGTAPRDKRQARRFLRGLARRFQDVGLPTWQINPLNPRSVDNLIEEADGTYKIIDLESALVSPLLPLGQWLDALRDGDLPVFDDVFVTKTRRYIASNRSDLQESLGEAGVAELEAAVADYDFYAARWKAAEPRLWTKLARAGLATAHIVGSAAKLVWPPSLLRSAKRLLRQVGAGQHLAQGWARQGIERWAEDGRITAEEASGLEASLAAPETVSVFTHLGAHLAMSVPLRFPFGSIARPAWTLFFRSAGELRGLVRRDGSAARARSVHTLPVALLSAVPGVGAAAYVVAPPLRRNRVLPAVLLDQALGKLPFGLYRRLHLAELTVGLARRTPARPGLAGRLRQLRPSSVLPAAAARLSLVRPYGMMLAAVLLANGTVLAISAAYYLNGQTWPFGEFGLVSLVGTSELLAAGALALVPLFLVWRKRPFQDWAEARATLFWSLSGAGLLLFAFDDLLQVHERAGDLLASYFGDRVPGVNQIDELVTLSYVAAGLLGIYLFKNEIMARRPAAAILTMGIGAAALAVTLDVAARGLVEGAVWPAQMAAAALIFSAYAAHVRAVMMPARRRAAAAPLEMARELAVPVAGELALLRSPVPDALSRIEAWAVRLTAPRSLAGRLIAVDLVLSAVFAGSGYLLFGPGQQHQLFRDLGPASLFSVFQTALVGLLGVLIARRTDHGWRWNSFWLVGGIGFFFLSLDAPLDLHGKVGGLIQAYTPVEHPLGFHRVSDAIVGTYLLAGVTIVILGYRQLIASPAALLQLAAGAALVAGTVVVDGFGPHGASSIVVEETLELVAGAWLVGAFATRYREVAVTGTRSAPSLLPIREARPALAAVTTSAAYTTAAGLLTMHTSSCLAPRATTLASCGDKA